MIASLRQIGATSAALVLLLPYAIRFDLKVPGRLPLRRPVGWGLLWPVVTWVRALGKSWGRLGWARWAAALSGNGLLLMATALAICSGPLALTWLVAASSAGRVSLALFAPSEPGALAKRRDGLVEGLISSAVQGLALVGPAVLVAARETCAVAGYGWILSRQPLALLVACVTTAGGWVDAVSDRDAPTAALTFHRLHASGASAWLVTGSYVWRACGLAMLTAGFFPSAAWITRLLVVMIGLPLLLWLRRLYAVGLRRRLGWRFWPFLAILAGASSAVTVGMVTSAIR